MMGRTMGMEQQNEGMPLGRKEERIYRKHTSLQVSVPHYPGGLFTCLETFKRYGFNLTKIESRTTIPHQRQSEGVTIFIDFEGVVEDPKVQAMIVDLKRTSLFVAPLESYTVPWFPKKPSDLDEFINNCMMAGTDLESDHPGFHDKTYRERREMIADIAFKYKYGEPIPRVDYTDTEKATWGAVWRELMKLFSTHTCSQYQQIMPLLVENCGFREDNIPQLGDISDFLKAQTGFTLKPIAGLLSSRDFLNGLAFRVFHSTQYIRHHSKPLYTPEPDICHELLGHAPLLADPDFADFSQAIGLASLGVSDEAIKKLATCYWFTVEYGLVRQNGQRRAYGAGLLSSYGELAYCLGPEPEVLPFDPEVTCEKTYPITTYQPTYFICDSFAKMKEQMTRFSTTLCRPFEVTYNPYLQTVEENPFKHFA